MAATQFVYEEAYVKKYDIPALKVVGWEGILRIIYNETNTKNKLTFIETFYVCKRFVLHRWYQHFSYFQEYLDL